MLSLNGWGNVYNRNAVYDPNTLSWVAMQQPSTAAGAGGAGSTIVSVANQVRVSNSTAADLLTVISGNSTVAPLAGSVWSIQGNSTVAPLAGSLWTIQGNSTVAPLAGSTWATRPIQSSAADLQMTATPLAGSTWNVRALQSSAADFQVTVTPASGWGSSAAPSSGGNAFHVRQALDPIQTFSSSNAFASTLAAINSTVAGEKCRVFAYSITSTVQTVTKIAFYKGSSMVWPVVLASISSAVTGANFGVSPPGYLFQSAAGSSVTLRTPSSVAGFKVAVSYWMGA